MSALRKRPGSRDRALAAGSPDSAEVRDFVRGRLALFAKVAFFLDLGFFVVSSAAALLTRTVTAAQLAREPGEITHFATIVVFGLLWLACELVDLGPVALAVADATTVVVTSTLFVAGALIEPDGAAILPTVLSFTNLVLARAVLVPSSPARTVLVSAAGGIPVVMLGAAHASLLLKPLHAGGDWPRMQATLVMLWVMLACALATVASQVIFGLRREVAQARRLGQYTLEEKIGEGGMGEVWRASHALLRRPTAIKLLLPRKSGDVGDARFEREVQLTARLTHPNTVAVYDYGRTSDGIFYYAMEMLDGVNLHDLVLAEGPLPPGRIIHVLRQVCGSLAEAHGHGLIHRDVKPANVILCERGGLPDVAKVVDFGLATSVAGGADVSLGMSDTIAGTPRHMAPEAISAPGSVGPAADLYGLGTLAYWLATGEHVFEGENFIELCAHHLNRAPEPPSSRARNTAPPDLERLIMRCLEKHPSRRHDDAASLERDLAACRDAGAWTREDAFAWWTERWPRLRDSRARRAPPTTSVTREAHPTLSVIQGIRR